MTKKKILFVCEAVSLAHVTRPLLCAETLDRNQYDVHIAVCSAYKDWVRDKGFTWHCIDTMPSPEFIKRLKAAQPVYPVDWLRAYVTQERTLLAALRPDLVIGDFRITLGISCELLSLPYACLIQAFWSPWYAGTYHAPEHWLTDMLGQRFMNRLLPLFFHHHAAAFNSVRRSYGLRSLPSLQHIYTHGDFTLYTDLPDLLQMRDLPATHRFIGPIASDTPVALPDWWDLLPSHKPLIYFSMGSSGDVSVVHTVLGAIAVDLYTVVISTAARLRADDIPRGVFVTDYIPGSEITKRAALVISNGGSGTVYTAIAQGVPVLGIPTNLDQCSMMDASVRSGFAIALRPSKLTAAQVRGAIVKLIEQDTFRRCARTMQTRLKQYNWKERFTDFINSYVVRSER